MSKIFDCAKRHKILAVFLVIMLLIIVVQARFWYEDRQLEEKINNLPIPSSWELIHVEKGGNRLCMDSCPGIFHMYSANIDPSTIMDEFKYYLEESEFEVTDIDSACNTRSSDDSVRCLARGESSKLTISLALRNTYITRKIDNETIQSDQDIISIGLRYKSYP